MYNNNHFTSVLTLCSDCRKKITVKATYAERNNKFKCDECKKVTP